MGRSWSASEIGWQKVRTYLQRYRFQGYNGGYFHSTANLLTSSRLTSHRILIAFDRE